MKRLVIAVVVVASAAVAFTVPASGQTDEVPSTTVAEAPTTTVAAPEPTVVVPEIPPTTVAPEAPPVTIPQVDLPGEHITSGELRVGASFEKAEASSCTATGSVAGGELNVLKDEFGNIGAVYGKASLGAADAGLVMVALGPLPIAIGAFRTTGACNQDVITIGSYTSTPTSATMTSVGYGLYPQDFAPSVDIALNVGATEATAALNLQGAYDFLAAKRPGQ